MEGDECALILFDAEPIVICVELLFREGKGDEEFILNIWS